MDVLTLTGIKNILKIAFIVCWQMLKLAGFMALIAALVCFLGFFFRAFLLPWQRGRSNRDRILHLEGRDFLMENDKRYTSVGDENKEQVTKRLRQQIEECLENDKPIIVGLENDLYTLGRTQSPEKLIKFVMKATKGLAEMIEKATGFLTAKDFLEITISVMVEAEEGKASEQKTDAQEQKPLH